MRITTLGVLVLPLLLSGAPQKPRVQVTANEAQRRVDITIDGQPFTSYIWPATLKKPVLYPLRSAKGTIVHRAIVEAKSGADRGELAVAMDWLRPDGKAIVHERTRFVFSGTADSRVIDRITTLTADAEKVVFKDNKEAFLGMRVARALEQPYDKPEILTDASGTPGAAPVADNTGVSGEYISSEGLKGDAVWGTRGRWTLLHGTVEQQPVTLAILDNPSNPGFPSYWHARGYGLFAANPLGQAALVNGKAPLNLTLEPGASVSFRYRVLILNGTAAPEDIEKRYQAFAQQGS